MSADKLDTCSEMRKKFDLHDLDAASMEKSDVASMQTHFQECARCKNWLATWEIVKMGAKQISDRPAPANLAQNVMAKLDAESAPTLYYREIMFAAACLVVFLAFLAVLGSETLSEILAWCASFAILVLAQRIFTVMQPHVVAKA
jgi:predicted anti-sigma-YlaC factor YlaD